MKEPVTVHCSSNLWYDCGKGRCLHVQMANRHSGMSEHKLNIYIQYLINEFMNYDNQFVNYISPVHNTGNYKITSCLDECLLKVCYVSSFLIPTLSLSWIIFQFISNLIAVNEIQSTQRSVFQNKWWFSIYISSAVKCARHEAGECEGVRVIVACHVLCVGRQCVTEKVIVNFNFNIPHRRSWI